MAVRRKTQEATSDQTQQWISEKFVGPRRKAAIEELERLEQFHGRLVPHVIVDAARSPTSALHSFFEWNDSKAAEKYRLIQAGMLVRHVQVVITPPDMEPRTVRAWVSPSPGGGYFGVARVLSDKEMRARLLEQARTDLIAFQNRYNVLTELDRVFAAIEASLTPKKKTRKKAS